MALNVLCFRGLVFPFALGYSVAKRLLFIKGI